MFKNICFFIIGVLACSATYSQTVNNVSAEEANVYQKIADVTLNVNEKEVKLSDLYHQSPLIIAQVFSRCSGICTPYLIQLKENLWQVRQQKQYRVLVFSFDPRDSEKDMLRLAKSYSLDKDSSWIFATTEQIELLNHSIGFQIYWDNNRFQYEHGVLLTGISKEGIIKRKLIGMRDAEAIGGMINEINETFVPSYPLPSQNSIFSCFNYDPASGKSKPGIGLFIMLMPILLSFLLVLFLGSSKKGLDQN